ncbi:Laccase-15 [Capsicum baccatum]|uniref:Laccase-15 n=1 Tax=Capsicum baccatum TaxID=33114 RepID=A0A2G2VS44_CAPBA|nr:Laccase-15 [Capsicum baccatum]
MNTFPCQNESCSGPNGDRFAVSMNNISFVLAHIDILGAYYKNIKGLYRDEFPSFLQFNFNFIGDSLPVELQRPDQRTQVHVLEYGTNIEIVLQGSSLLGGIDHPIHLHGYSFYVVGLGLGNFDKDKDPFQYNLVDSPLQSTITIVRNGWATIRFETGAFYFSQHHCLTVAHSQHNFSHKHTMHSLTI